MKIKVCSKCYKEKPLSAFWKDSSKSDGGFKWEYANCHIINN